MEEQTLLEGAQERIAQHRQADAQVRVVNASGQPLPGVPVRVEQTRSAFLFGANAFLLGGPKDPKGEYARRFADLLNFATLPFYWGMYEPTPGQTREQEVRAQAEWCAGGGITIKGHPLVWHEVYPEWGPTEVAETKTLLRARVTEIVSRFAGLIDTWDVVNEATVSARPAFANTGVGQWAQEVGDLALVQEALGWAHAANPSASLLYNDWNMSADYERLAGGLVSADAPVAAFGIQSHMHQEEWSLAHTWEVCETYARFGKPLHFTELTVLSGEHGWRHGAESTDPWPSTPEGEAHQADYVERFYTLLFSHPAVEAITWWDLADGDKAWQGAPAGLLREDLSPKPAYQRLLSLIHGAWRTNTQGVTDTEGLFRFRGFHGDYRITAAGAEAELHLARNRDNSLTVTVS